MLTLLKSKTNLAPLMQIRTMKLSLSLLSLILLQSCYTILRPPQTLPETVSTVTTSMANASSFGGTGYYGWDPYWEPALPFTSYHRGYGASYYSPYNYYDYHDPYYAPVYVVSESADPVPGRSNGRNDRQGGPRDRSLNPTSSSSGSGQSSGGTSTGSGMAAPPPVYNPPVIKPPMIVKPVKPIKQKAVKSSNEGREVKPIRNVKVKPPKKKKTISSSEKDAVKKRTRTRD